TSRDFYQLRGGIFSYDYYNNMLWNVDAEANIVSRNVSAQPIYPIFPGAFTDLEKGALDRLATSPEKLTGRESALLISVILARLAGPQLLPSARTFSDPSSIPDFQPFTWDLGKSTFEALSSLLDVFEPAFFEA